MLKSFLLKRLAAGGFCTLVTTAAVAAYADVEFANEASKSAHNTIKGEQSLMSETPKIGNRLSSTSHDQLSMRLARNALDKQALAAAMLSLRQENRTDEALKVQALLGQVSRRSSEYLRAEIQLADQTKDLNRAVTALGQWSSMSPAKRNEIFPVLILALAEPSGATLIKQRETWSWYIEFLTAGTRDPKNLEVVAQYLLANPMRPGDLRDRLLGDVVKGYLTQNEVAKAQDFASAFGELDVDWNSLAWTDPDMTIANTPLFWQYPNSDAIVNIDKNGTLTLLIEGELGNKPIALKRMAFQPDRTITIKSHLNIPNSMNIKDFIWFVRCKYASIEQISKTNSNFKSNEFVTSVIFKTNNKCKDYSLALSYIRDLRFLPKQSVRISKPTIHF